jgi:hypothetical protein
MLQAIHDDAARHSFIRKSRAFVTRRAEGATRVRSLAEGRARRRAGGRG